MTREEREDVINFLKGYLDEEIYTEKCRNAHEMAIKSLEQEPCEDAISRQAVINITWQDPTYTDPLNVLTEVRDKVKALPPVTPTQRWIPVSERLPKENETVMASTEYGVYPETRYTKEYGWEWAYEAGADYWDELNIVVEAWMPLPEPYKVESEEKRNEIDRCR